MSASSSVIERIPSRGREQSFRQAHPLLMYAGRRVLAGIATLVVVSFLIFVAVQLLPGNVVTAVLGRNGTPQAVAQLSKTLHLNEPFLVRYWHWVSGVVTGRLGHPLASIVQGQTTITVWQDIKHPLINSLVLAVAACLILIPVSFVLGVYAALRAGRLQDRAISGIALVFNALPEFLTGTILIVVFFTALHLLPPISAIPPGTSPLSNIKELILPVLTLIGVALAAAVRMIRAGSLETLQTNFVASARLNGLREKRILLRYVIRNSLAPSVQVFAQTAQYLLGGIIITESVFDYPGIGTTLVQAVNVRDVQVIAAISIILATVYIAINIVADLIVVMLVPKLRTGDQ